MIVLLSIIIATKITELLNKMENMIEVVTCDRGFALISIVKPKIIRQ